MIEQSTARLASVEGRLPNNPAPGEISRVSRGEYQIRRVPFDLADEAVLNEWHSLRQQIPSNDPMKHPDWIRGYFSGQTDNLSVYLLYSAGALCGIAPFLLKQWPLKFHIGDRSVGTFPLLRLRNVGSEPDFPPDSRAFDLLFREILQSTIKFDAFYLEEIPLDSYFWKYLHESEFVRRNFLLYEPDEPSPHPLLRFQGSFEQYMQKFSPKHRKNLSREVKKIRDGILGPMRLVRYEAPEEVDPFLKDAIEISRRTYQWKVHQRGLSAIDLVTQRSRFAAAQGWMRSYLLFCGEKAVAFIWGFQYSGRFLLHEIGFDPVFAKYSIGTVLLMLAVEDMFAHDCPEILDLGEYGKYKEMLSTESYLQGKMFLFRRGIYGRLLMTGHRGCAATTAKLLAILERMDWKTKVKKVLRGWSGSEPAIGSAPETKGNSQSVPSESAR